LDAPFDGSTESKFDSTLANLPQGSTIHILAGTYQTFGDFGSFHIKSFDHIIGSGEDVTIVQLATNATDNAWVMADYGPLGLMDSNITVENLTLDGNYQGGTKTFHGLTLNGPNMTAKDVKVIDLTYFDSTVNSEAWEIEIGGPNALIEHCLAENFWGGVGNAISTFTINGAAIGGVGYVYAGSGAIRDNTIIFTNNTGSCIGVGAAFSNGVLIQGNIINCVGAGVYNDTGNSTNITIVNKIFQNVRYGLYFGNGYNVRQNYIFDNNNVMLATNFAPSFAAGLNLGNGCTNWNITGNMVGWYYPPQPGTIGYFLVCASDQQGILVANNRVDASLGNYVTTNGYTAYGNYDFTGNWLTNLDQTPF
jgi:hypothetical protein